MKKTLWFVLRELWEKIEGIRRGFEGEINGQNLLKLMSSKNSSTYFIWMSLPTPRFRMKYTKAKDASKKPLMTCKGSPIKLSDLSSGALEFRRWHRDGKGTNKPTNSRQPRSVCLGWRGVQLSSGSWAHSLIQRTGEGKRFLHLTELVCGSVSKGTCHQI